MSEKVSSEVSEKKLIAEREDYVEDLSLKKREGLGVEGYADDLGSDLGSDSDSVEKRELFGKISRFRDSAKDFLSLEKFRERREEQDFVEKVFDKFSGRVSCRSFSDKGVEMSLIYDIISASLKAPCAGNVYNSWIVVITDSEQKHKLARIHGEQTWAGEAPVMLAVVRETARLEELFPNDFYDLSIMNSSAVITSIINLCEVAGLGACWVKAGDNAETCEVLGCGSDLFVDALIPIGYSDDVRNFKNFVEPVERIFFNKYGSYEKK